jgi:hypothetical protein
MSSDPTDIISHMREHPPTEREAEAALTMILEGFRDGFRTPELEELALELMEHVSPERLVDVMGGLEELLGDDQLPDAPVSLLDSVSDLRTVHQVAMASSRREGWFDFARAGGAVATVDPRLLAQAEGIAERLAGTDGAGRQRFALWKERRPPASQLDVGVQVAVAAGTAPIVDTHPTHGAFKGDEGHTLKVWNRSGVLEFKYSVTLPAEPRSWRYRLHFRPEDEAEWLRERGLGRGELSILFGMCGTDEEAWTSLVDLLIPHRYGASDDDLFPASDAGRWRRLQERMPGQPQSCMFEVC